MAMLDARILDPRERGVLSPFRGIIGGLINVRR